MQSKTNSRYPLLCIRSKNEIAKRISSKNFSKEKALTLINDVLANHDRYWHDVMNYSEPEKGKFVRSCKETKLGRLLWLIDKKILTPHDHLVPEFIFGGISEKDHVRAAQWLLGSQRKRTLLKLDISKFFEQNKNNRVFGFFRYKCKCSPKAAKILTDLCCVPLGRKNSKNPVEVLARGFATSTRLALWCNLDLFLRLYWKTKGVLRGNDPRVTIFIDDIGITASRVEKNTMYNLSNQIEKILDVKDASHSLPINQTKKQNSIISYLDKNMEHLGIRLGRNKLSPGKKTRDKQSKINKQLKKDGLTSANKKILINKKKSYKNYERYIKKVNRENL